MLRPICPQEPKSVTKMPKEPDCNHRQAWGPIAALHSTLILNMAFFKMERGGLQSRILSRYVLYVSTLSKVLRNYITTKILGSTTIIYFISVGSCINSLSHLSLIPSSANHIKDLGPAVCWWAMPIKRFIGVLEGMVS